jgi:hypothetical protein
LERQCQLSAIKRPSPVYFEWLINFGKLTFVRHTRVKVGRPNDKHYRVQKAERSSILLFDLVKSDRSFAKYFSKDRQHLSEMFYLNPAKPKNQAAILAFLCSNFIF